MCTDADTRPVALARDPLDLRERIVFRLLELCVARSSCATAPARSSSASATRRARASAAIAVSSASAALRLLRAAPRRLVGDPDLGRAARRRLVGGLDLELDLALAQIDELELVGPRARRRLARVARATAARSRSSYSRRSSASTSRRTARATA